MGTLGIDLLMAWRNLMQRGRHTLLLVLAIGAVTSLLVVLSALSAGVNSEVFSAATKVWTGHVNINGFYKIGGGRVIPLVTSFEEVAKRVEQVVPEAMLVAPRGRGFAQVISDTRSMSLALTGVSVDKEPAFLARERIVAGSLADLSQPNTAVLFESHAERLKVGVGDTLTLSAPTGRGFNNAVDVQVVAVAKDIGMLSSFSMFVSPLVLNTLYDSNPEATGIIQVVLKPEDVDRAAEIAGRLREVLGRDFAMMPPDSRASWMRIQDVEREDWTGQKLDVNTWENEVSFVTWTVTAIDALTFVLVAVLLGIVAVGITNTMWIAVRERTREVGTLRAIGMPRRQVLSLFLLESLMLGLAGTLLGAAAGAAAALALNAAGLELPEWAQMFLMSDTLTLLPLGRSIAKTVALITLVTGAAALYPAIRAARLGPVVATRHAG